jgi:hypothetical protein
MVRAFLNADRIAVAVAAQITFGSDLMTGFVPLDGPIRANQDASPATDASAFIIGDDSRQRVLGHSSGDTSFGAVGLLAMPALQAKESG